ncbi:MAG: GIY-YIG nuclease family protein [Planctomycetota bacterium]
MCNKKGNLYTGITTDLDNRMRQHGHAELLFTEEYQDKKDAAKREREIKGWRR